MQVGIEALLKVPPENRREFIQCSKMLPHFEGCRDNCIYHKLFEDVEELNHFLWIEYWADPNTMEQYMQSERFKTLLGAIETLGELIHLKKVTLNCIDNH